MAFRFALTIACLLAAVPLPSVRAEPVAVKASPVPLNPEDGAQRTAGALTYMGGVELTSDHDAFGGLSSLILSADGRNIMAVTDRGHWLRARLDLDGRGQLVGLSEVEMFPMKARNLVPLSGRLADAEALVDEAGGRLLVAFERYHRLWRFSLHDGLDKTLPEDYPAPPDLARAPSNKGIEAMTRLADGRLFLMTEDYVDANDMRQGWISQGTRYHTVTQEVRDLFKPTDMTVLPNGDVLLLERRFTIVGGAAARLSVISTRSIVPGAVLKPQAIAVLQPPMTVDNMEGVAATEGPGISTDIYILSDDNFNAIQRTLLMKFRLGG